MCVAFSALAWIRTQPNGRLGVHSAAMKTIQLIPLLTAGIFTLSLNAQDERRDAPPPERRPEGALPPDARRPQNPDRPDARPSPERRPENAPPPDARPPQNRERPDARPSPERRPESGRPSPQRGPGPEAEKRTRHIREAIENLHAAGLHDVARHLAKRLEHGPGHPPHHSGMRAGKFGGPSHFKHQEKRPTGKHSQMAGKHHGKHPGTSKQKGPRPPHGPRPESRENR